MFSQAYAASTLPLSATEVAVQWDHLYSFVVWLSVFFFVLVVGGMLVFMKKYKHVPGRKTEYFKDSHLLEAIWVGVPTAILMVLFVWGYWVYHTMRQTPADAYEIRVIGKQWLWNFQYDNGRMTTGEVFVPMNRPVKLIMTSEDVLHGFFIPNFRVKQDVVPGMYTSLWFKATIPGKHQVFCTEYCGTSHSGMLAKVVVLDDAQWEAWNNNKKVGEIPTAGEGTQGFAQAEFSLVEQGRIIHESKGCVACHSVDGSIKVGPSHKGVFGQKLEMANGQMQVVDENFIRSHIENPNANTVKGYAPVMPTFKGLITEAEMNALIAYMKSLN
jgi:cytochrome c oxidase subunit 2